VVPKPETAAAHGQDCGGAGHWMAENQQKPKTNERFETMKNFMLIRGLAAFAACALVLPMVGSPKHPVQGPFKAAGISALIVDPNDPYGASGTFEIVGNATHLGNFVFPGTWAIIGFNEEGGYIYEIHGTYTAANGDTIEIESLDWGVDDGLNPTVSTGIVEIIGGTGRFANASGSYVGALSPAGMPTLFTAEGTISY
jgi:hypothetical protein